MVVPARPKSDLVTLVVGDPRRIPQTNLISLLKPIQPMSPLKGSKDSLHGRKDTPTPPHTGEFEHTSVFCRGVRSVYLIPYNSFICQLTVNLLNIS